MDSFQKMSFPVIGIGASAGGVEQLQEFFDRLGTNTNCSFIVVQHLPQGSKSFMQEILQAKTKLDVLPVTKDLKIEASKVYLGPPGASVVVNNGYVRPCTRDKSIAIYHPINALFRSLAQEYGSQAVGLILSGTGNDGATGVSLIGEAGGHVLVENSSSTPFTSMPDAARFTGMANLVAPIEELVEAILHYEKTGKKLKNVQKSESDIAKEHLVSGDRIPQEIKPIIKLLNEKFNIDFNDYKMTTVLRRVERRKEMLYLKGMNDYYQTLVEDDLELTKLLNDLLIGVTKFFRDEPFFRVLREEVISDLLSSLADEEELRVWVPGCATGEEAYSIAMEIDHYQRKNGLSHPFKVFGSDIVRNALTIANLGVYHESKMEGIPEEYRNTYFEKTKKPGEFVITKDLRQHLLFASQNLIKNPPFTKMHFVSCRNLLIYLNIDAQKKVLSLLHFSLKVNGHLILGPSENLSLISGDYKILSREWKVYKKKTNSNTGVDLSVSRKDLKLGSPHFLEVKSNPIVNSDYSHHRISSSYDDQALVNIYDSLLDKFLPPSLLFSEEHKLIHVIGESGKYLKNTGRLSGKLNRIFSSELRAAIRGGILNSSKDGGSTHFKDIPIKSEKDDTYVDIEVTPYPLGIKQYFLVCLYDKETLKKDTHRDIQGKTFQYHASSESSKQVDALQEELNLTKQSLQATIEELENTNEKLNTSNEELMSSNEELQSTNEELHSTNEELRTVNTQYQLKLEELSRLNEDIENLYKSTDIAIIFLDKNNNVRKFSPASTNIFNLLHRDLGRKLSDIKSSLADEKLDDKISQGGDFEVKTRYGGIYLMRVTSYRKANEDHDELHGRVISFVDVTMLRTVEKQFRLAIEAAPSAMVMVNRNGDIVLSTYKALDLFNKSSNELEAVKFQTLFSDKSQKDLKELFKRIFDHKTPDGESERRILLTREKEGAAEKKLEVSFTDASGKSIDAAIISITDVSSREKEYNV